MNSVPTLVIFFVQPFDYRYLRGNGLQCKLVTTIDLKYDFLYGSSGSFKFAYFLLKPGQSFIHIQAKPMARKQKLALVSKFSRVSVEVFHSFAMFRSDHLSSPKQESNKTTRQDSYFGKDRQTEQKMHTMYSWVHNRRVYSFIWPPRNMKKETDTKRDKSI